MTNQKSLTWEASEFKYYHKTAGWYITLFSVSVLIIAFFVLVESDIFAAVCTGIIALLILFFSFHKPQPIEISLSDRGLHFGNLFYPYKQIKYFWIVYNQNHQTLNFHTTAMVNHIVIVELENQDPDEVRRHLLPHIPEHHKVRETVIQKIMHIFNF